MENCSQAWVSSTVVPKPSHETVVAALEAAAREGGPFATFHGAREVRTLDFGAALEGAWRWSALLRARGVARGDRIPILLPTGPTFVTALLGTMLAGAVPVPLASPMTFGGLERYLRNLATIVEDAGAEWLITYPRIRDALATDAVLRDALRGGVLTEGELAGTGQPHRLLPSISGSDTALLQYTSGTTGRPKGVVVSHRALVCNAFAIAHGLGLTDRDVGVSWLPMFHDMGLIGVLLTAVCHPYVLHLMPPELFVMRPLRWLRVISEVGGTLSAAPNFAYELCVARGDDLSGLFLKAWRLALNGSEPVHAGTVERFRERFCSVGFRREAMLPVYGLAESTLAVTFSTLEEGYQTLTLDREKLETQGRAVLSTGRTGYIAVSVGRPVAGTTVAITDSSGRVLSEGCVGEVRVSGPSVMDGYFRNEEASAAVLSGGWLRTGDLGFIHQGKLYITGRAKEVMIKAGRNVYPYDVERIVSEVPGVRPGGVAAFGRPNPETGTDDVVVIVETTETDQARREAIVRAVRGELLAVLGIKADEVHLWPVGAVPRTTSGKIRRQDCARMLGENNTPLSVRDSMTEER